MISAIMLVWFWFVMATSSAAGFAAGKKWPVAAGFAWSIFVLSALACAKLMRL